MNAPTGTCSDDACEQQGNPLRERCGWFDYQFGIEIRLCGINTLEMVSRSSASWNQIAAGCACNVEKPAGTQWRSV